MQCGAVQYSTVVQWYSGTVVQWYSGTVVQWYSGTVVQWYSGTVVQWYSGTVVQWYSGTVVQWCSIVQYSTVQYFIVHCANFDFFLSADLYHVILCCEETTSLTSSSSHYTVALADSKFDDLYLHFNLCNKNVNALIAYELSGFTCTRPLRVISTFSIPHFSFVVSELVQVNPDYLLTVCVNL